MLLKQNGLQAEKTGSGPESSAAGPPSVADDFRKIDWRMTPCSVAYNSVHANRIAPARRLRMGLNKGRVESDIMFEKLQPVSKKSRVVATLKKAIISGELQSGDQIVEGKLAEQLGVGQGLIREALIDLEHQGFIERAPFSFTQVARFDNEDADQIFDIRIEVEPLAFSLAARHATRGEIAELWDLVHRASAGADERSLGAFFDHHLAYRRKVWELSGNRFLRETLERLVAPLYALYLMRSDFNRQGLFETIQECIEHQEATLRAFEAGSPDEAARIVRAFLVQMKQNLGSSLLPTQVDRDDAVDLSED